MEYPWITEAKKKLGLDENKDSAVITGWVKELGLGWFTATFRPNTVSWCGIMIAICLKHAGLGIIKSWYRALDWMKWGVALEKPIVGCLAILTRQGGGHVFFVLGEDTDGCIIGIGGNQSNKVTIAKFDKARVTAYRWPSDYSLPVEGELPMMTLAGALSTNEA